MARSFNGSTDIITCGTGTPAPSGFFTASVWAKLSASPVARGIVFSRSDVAGQNAFFMIIRNTGKIDFEVGNGGAYTAIDPGTATISTGVWTHLVLTFDSSITTMKAYVNGVSDGTQATSALGNMSGMASYIGGYFGGLNFAGDIADAAQWNAVLTASEITALASGVRPYRIRRNALVGYWPLEGTASPEPDVINGNNGALTGTSGVANPFNYTTPKYGSRSFIRANADKMVVAALPTSAVDNITLSIWAKVTSTIADAQMSLYIGDGAADGYGLHAQGGNFPNTNWGILVGGIAWVNAATTLTPGVWYHLLAKRTSGTWTFWLNGISESTSSGSPATTPNAPSTFTSIGDDKTASRTMGGSLADAAIWNVALSAAEVTKLAQGFRSHQVRTSGLVGYWPCEGTASPEPDMIAANNMTVTGTSAAASPDRYKDIVGA